MFNVAVEHAILLYQGETQLLHVGSMAKCNKAIKKLGKDAHKL